MMPIRITEHVAKATGGPRGGSASTTNRSIAKVSVEGLRLIEVNQPIGRPPGPARKPNKPSRPWHGWPAGHARECQPGPSGRGVRLGRIEIAAPRVAEHTS